MGAGGEGGGEELSRRDAARAGPGARRGEGTVEHVQVDVDVDGLAASRQVVEQRADVTDRIRPENANALRLAPQAMGPGVGEPVDADLDDVAPGEAGVEKGPHGRAVAHPAGVVGPDVVMGVEGEQPPTR